MKFSVHFLAIFLLVIFSASDPSEGTIISTLKTVGSSIRGAAVKSYHTLTSIFSDIDPKIDVRIRRKHKKTPQTNSSKENLPLCSTVKKVLKPKFNNKRRKNLLAKDKITFLPTAETRYDDYFMEYLSPSVEGLERTAPDREMAPRRRISFMGQKRFPYTRIDQLRDKYRKRLQARPRVSSRLDPELDDTLPEYDSDKDVRTLDLYDDMYDNGNFKQKYSNRHQENVKKNPSYVNPKINDTRKNQQRRLKVAQNIKGQTILDMPDDTIEDLVETKIGELSTSRQAPSYNKNLTLIDSFMANPLSVHSTWTSNETITEKNISRDNNNITKESSSNQDFFNFPLEIPPISAAPFTNSSFKQNVSTSLQDKKKEINEKKAMAVDDFRLNQMSSDDFKDNMEDENLVDHFVDSNSSIKANNLLRNYKKNEPEGLSKFRTRFSGILQDKMEIEDLSGAHLANSSFKTSLKGKKKEHKLNGSAKFNITRGSSNYVTEILEEEAPDGAPVANSSSNHTLQKTFFNRKKGKKFSHHKFQPTEGLLSRLEKVMEEQKQISNASSTTTLANSETTEGTIESELAEKKFNSQEKDFDTLIV